MGFCIATLCLTACGDEKVKTSTPPQPSNSAPIYESATAFTTDENHSDNWLNSNNTAFETQLLASDSEGDQLRFTLQNSPDFSLFSLTSSGNLSYQANRIFNFEKPDDSNGDNQYEISVGVSDGKATTSIALTLTILDVNERPSFYGPFSSVIFENEAFAAELNITDPEGQPLSVTLPNRGDNQFFEVANSGELTSTQVFDFEVPEDQGRNNEYNVYLEISDGVHTNSNGFTLYVEDTDDFFDVDGDGFEDQKDAFPTNNAEWIDADNDNVGDNSDNCRLIFNSDQTDTDKDGLGDTCDPDETILIRGRFMDSPTSNINVDGIPTDDEGYYYCVEGEILEFTVANISLGSSSCSPVTSPFDLSDETGIGYIHRVNAIAQFLQTLDEDRNPANGITISNDAVNQLFIDQDTRVDIVDFNIEDWLAQNSDINLVLVSLAEAAAHMEEVYKNSSEFDSKFCIYRLYDSNSFFDGVKPDCTDFKRLRMYQAYVRPSLQRSQQTLDIRQAIVEDFEGFEDVVDRIEGYGKQVASTIEMGTNFTDASFHSRSVAIQTAMTSAVILEALSGNILNGLNVAGLSLDDEVQYNEAINQAIMLVFNAQECFEGSKFAIGNPDCVKAVMQGVKASHTLYPNVELKNIEDALSLLAISLEELTRLREAIDASTKHHANGRMAAASAKLVAGLLKKAAINEYGEDSVPAAAVSELYKTIEAVASMTECMKNREAASCVEAVTTTLKQYVIAIGSLKAAGALNSNTETQAAIQIAEEAMKNYTKAAGSEYFLATKYALSGPFDHKLYLDAVASEFGGDFDEKTLWNEYSFAHELLEVLVRYNASDFSALISTALPKETLIGETVDLKTHFTPSGHVNRIYPNATGTKIRCGAEGASLDQNTTIYTHASQSYKGITANKQLTFNSLGIYPVECNILNSNADTNSAVLARSLNYINVKPRNGLSEIFVDTTQKFSVFEVRVYGVNLTSGHEFEVTNCTSVTKRDFYDDVQITEGASVAILECAVSDIVAYGNGSVSINLNEEYLGSYPVYFDDPDVEGCDDAFDAPDTDGDGVSDPCDADDDGDGIPDIDELLEGVHNEPILRVSVNSNGIQGNDQSYFPSISADGTSLVFLSKASNLISNDSNELIDVFFYDLKSKSIELISKSSDGEQADSHSYSPSISGDGRYVIFDSGADNLGPSSTPVSYLYLVDRKEQSTNRISDYGRIGDSIISESGNVIAFSPPVELMRLYDRVTDAYSWASIEDWRGSLPPSSSSANPSSPVISANDRYLAYTSYEDLIGSGGYWRTTDVYLYDRSNGSTEVISLSESDRDSISPAISGSGRHVVFASSSTNDVSNKKNKNYQIFLYDRNMQSMEILSSDSEGNEGNHDSFDPSISRDGRYIVFSSSASNLIANDTNNFADVFLLDRTSQKLVLLSKTTNGIQANSASFSPKISADGSTVAFESYASNLVQGDTNEVRDVFIVSNPLK